MAPLTKTVREVNWAVVHEAIRMCHDPDVSHVDFGVFIMAMNMLNWWHGYVPLQSFIEANYPPEYAAYEREMGWT